MCPAASPPSPLSPVGDLADALDDAVGTTGGPTRLLLGAGRPSLYSAGMIEQEGNTTLNRPCRVPRNPAHGRDPLTRLRGRARALASGLPCSRHRSARPSFVQLT